MPLRPEVLPSISTEYVYSVLNGPDDPTGWPVEFAFMTSDDEPEPSDFHLGQWLDSEQLTSIERWRATAAILIGPDGVLALAPGTYYCWVRVNGAPEVPTKRAGKLRIGA